MELVQELTHSFTAEASPEVVWLVLWDVPVLARCLPGCEGVTAQAEGKSYTAHVRRKIAAFSITFELNIAVVASEVNRLISLQVAGRDKRLRSELRQDLEVRLSPLGGALTKIEITTIIRLEGLLASLGKNLVSMQFFHVLDDFAENLLAAIKSRAAQVAPGKPAANPRHSVSGIGG